MTNDKATPRPWYSVTDPADPDIEYVQSAKVNEDNYVCETSKADAALIVKAVNSYGALLSACKLALLGETNIHTRKTLQEAINQSEGK